MSNKKALILASGGIDSTAAIALYLAEGFSVEALFFDYGQVAAPRELAAISGVAGFYKIPLRTATCGGLGSFRAGLVRGRNAFLLHGALMAFPGEAGVVVIGVHAGTDYTDCSAEFIEGMSRMFDSYSDGRIKVGAPFLTWEKSQIIEFCRARGVPIGMTYSCENGKQQPCGCCDSCKDLERFYEMAR